MNCDPWWLKFALPNNSAVTSNGVTCVWGCLSMVFCHACNAMVSPRPFKSTWLQSGPPFIVCKKPLSSPVHCLLFLPRITNSYRTLRNASETRESCRHIQLSTRRRILFLHCACACSCGRRSILPTASQSCARILILAPTLHSQCCARARSIR